MPNWWPWCNDPPFPQDWVPHLLLWDWFDVLSEFTTVHVFQLSTQCYLNLSLGFFMWSVEWMNQWFNIWWPLFVAMTSESLQSSMIRLRVWPDICITISMLFLRFRPSSMSLKVMVSGAAFLSIWVLKSTTSSTLQVVLSICLRIADTSRWDAINCT